ncbi:hypothetical protein [Caballeronia humi]|uniref:Lipoprotein n=1 Tax=Caballeronia humi TaxID=326474 RepID=A0A158J894_9BURK|nr:hypothetical protein [Caballeronia humi]SAL64550.1 hypothetical protein AWB65_06057 [Caballeronia humi]
MRVTELKRLALATVLLGAAMWASGADFDGSKALICATVDAHACDPGEVCLRDLPAGFGVPQFMNVNFAKKTIAGPKRSTEIRSIEKTADQVLMQGNELGYGWTVVLDQDGSMSMTLVNNQEVLVVFGYCTPQ